MLSKEVHDRLIAAHESEHDYEPDPTVASPLAQNELVMFVGTAAIGKTHIMEHIEQLDPRFGRVPIFSTRDARRDDDPAMFRIFPHDDESVTFLLDRIDRRKVVQYAVHPTEERIYGTEPRDYGSDYNMLATLASGTEQFMKLPFSRKHIIGLSADPAIWARWFNQRYPEGENRQKRLAEAAISLNWLLAPEQRQSVTFVKNEEGKAEEVAKEIIDVIVNVKNVSGSDARNQAVAMKGWARGALRRILEKESTHE